MAARASKRDDTVGAVEEFGDAEVTHLEGQIAQVMSSADAEEDRGWIMGLTSAPYSRADPRSHGTCPWASTEEPPASPGGEGPWTRNTKDPGRAERKRALDARFQRALAMGWALDAKYQRTQASREEVGPGCEIPVSPSQWMYGEIMLDSGASMHVCPPSGWTSAASGCRHHRRSRSSSPQTACSLR